MENLRFELADTLGHLQGDDTVFIVQLIDISRELAMHLINDIRECKGLDDVICRYSGDYKTGMAEFVVKKRKSGYFRDDEEVDNITLTYEQAAGLARLGALGRDNNIKYSMSYRHLVTTLCAALALYIHQRTTVAEQSEEFKSLIFDNMFDSKMFNCISSRLHMIEHLKDESKDFVKGSNCGACLFVERTLNKCTMSQDLSETLNRYLGYLSLDEFNTIVYSSKSDNSGSGLLTVRSNKFSNLTGWLDIEQFLDTNGLF